VFIHHDQSPAVAIRWQILSNASVGWVFLQVIVAFSSIQRADKQEDGVLVGFDGVLELLAIDLGKFTGRWMEDAALRRRLGRRFEIL
jgi:hypothetical protein